MFMCVELVGGILSGSLAILTDAAHQLSDVAGFVISFVAMWQSTKQGNLKYSYGYHRADAIGAMGSILIIWALVIWLCIEAVHRINHLDEVNIDPIIMLITAIIGLGCNILNFMTLQYCCNYKDEDGKPVDLNDSIASSYKKYNLVRHSFNNGKPKRHDEKHAHLPPVRETSQEDLESPLYKADKAVYSHEIQVQKPVKKAKEEESENLNIRAAMVHMLGDMITSAGVIVAALIICYNPEWKIADPICTFLFSVMVIHTTLPTMQEGFSVLLEAAPEDIDTVEVFNALN